MSDYTNRLAEIVLADADRQADGLKADAGTHFNLIRMWAHDRNLIEGSNAQAQMVKLVEEIGELAAGVARGDEARIEDGIGDAVVVLTILASQCGINIEGCIAAAWGEIKDRKGRMVDGVFVKEDDDAGE